MSGQTCAETKAPLFSSGLVCKALKRLGITKERWFVRIAGISDEVVIKPFNHTFSNLTRAVAERVFFVKRNGAFCRPPKPVHFSHSLSLVGERLKRLLPKTTPWSEDEFLASCKGAKKRRYEAAAESLLQERLSGKDARVEVFIKYEKTDCTSKVDPVPRVISPRTPRYNLMLGRYIKKIEHKIFKSIRKLYGSPTVLKGFNAYQSATILRDKWDRFSSPVAIGLDASRFDQHVSLDALRWEHDIYLSCFPLAKHRNELKWLLSLQEHNQCVGYCPDGQLSYSIDGTRMSGDMNTSLGNCVLMCSMVYQYAKDKNIVLELVNNGDDCVVVLDKADLNRFSDGLYEWFFDMGFDMKVEDPVYDFGAIEFCQTKPIYDGSRWIMCRNPRAVLSKDTCLLQPYQSSRQIAHWLYAVGMGGIRMTGGLPVLQNFYQAYIRYGRPGRQPQEYMSWYQSKQLVNMDRDFGTVTPEARLSMYDSFGITPCEQQEMEHFFDQWKFIFQERKSDHEDFLYRNFSL